MSKPKPQAGSTSTNEIEALRARLAVLEREHANRPPPQRGDATAEDCFSIAFRASPVAMLLIDLENERIIEISERFERMSGYSRAELIGRTALELNFWDKPEERDAMMQTLREQGSIRDSESIFRGKNGDLRRGRFSIELLRAKERPCMLVTCEDITERRKTEWALRQSEERYRTLVNTMNGGLVALDADRRIMFANDQLCACWGYPRDQLIGRHVERFFDEQNRKILSEKWTARKRGDRTPYEVELTRPDGRVVHMIISPSPMFDDAGRFVGGFAVITDISRLVKAEFALRASEQRYHALAEASPVGIFQTDPEGRCQVVNARWCEMTGLRPDQAMGEGWAAALHPDDRELVFEEWKRTANRGRPFHLEYRFKRPNGTTMWVVGQSVAERDADGRISGHIGTITDITPLKRMEEALRESEERYRVVAETDTDVILTIDEDSRIVFASPATTRVFGYRPEELVDRPLTRLIPQTLRALHTAALAQYIETGERHTDWQRVEFTGLRKSGEEVPLEVALGEHFHDGRRLFTGILRDITHRKQAEESLRQAHAKLERRVRERTAELIEANQHLTQEIADRRQAEESLRRFRAALDSSADSIFLIDRESMRFIDVNETSCRATGYSAHELLKMGPHDIKPGFSKDQLAGRFDAIIQGRDAVGVIETVHRRKDGSEFPVEVYVRPLKSNGRSLLVAVARDVTERMRAAAALRKSEERLEAILSNTPAVVYLKDLRGRYLLINDRYASLFHLSKEEVVGRTDHDIFPEEIADAFRANDRRVVETGEPLETEEVAPHDDGLHTYFSVKFPVRDPKGAVHAVGGISTDITPRKRDEEAIRNLARFPDENPSPVLRATAEGRILYANAASAPLMHACKCEIGGTLPPPALATLAKALETGEPQRLEVACGELVYSMLFAPIAGANYVNLYGRDITYRKLAEARLRRQALVFENMYDGVLLTDAQGLITELNPAAERMFGYAREELIGKSPEILNRTEEAAALTESILRGIEQDDRWSGEITFVRKDGTTGVCEASLVPLHNEEGVRIGTITVNRDLTASKEASQAKAELQEQLRQAQKMEALGTLASGITHDFENLLTAISGYTELAKGALPEGHAAAEALEKVEETAQQARSVTNALLAFSHRAVIPKKTVNLSATLDRAAHLLRRLLPPAIEIVDDLDRRKDLWIRGDAGQLQRILMNLAFNARDAMPDGGKLRFSLRDTGSSSEAAARPGGSRETRRAVLIVEDTGCGMSPEVRERIFEPFWTTKPRGVGTGLGLSLTLACVQDLGGEIVVRSEPGEGTRVTITLPTCEPPAEAESKKPAREPDRRPKRLVLVIERNQHIRSIITSTLRSRGYDVAAASTPTDAVAVLRRRSDAVRLMIIDFDLLDGSGMHPLKQACPPEKDLPVIILAGTLSLNLRDCGMENGYLLRKPFQMAELTAAVSHCMTRDPDEETRPS